MNSLAEALERLKTELETLHYKHELSKAITPDTFEPGMMENLDQWDGFFDPQTGIVTFSFEARGTRYDGRSEQIEKITSGEKIKLMRDPENIYNPNNFRLFTESGTDVGNMPAELCNAIVKLYDAGVLTVTDARVSYVEPITKRSRYAKQAVLFVRAEGKITSDR